MKKMLLVIVKLIVKKLLPEYHLHKSGKRSFSVLSDREKLAAFPTLDSTRVAAVQEINIPEKTPKEEIC